MAEFKVGDRVIYTGNHPHDYITRLISFRGKVVRVLKLPSGVRYTVHFFDGKSIVSARPENLEIITHKPEWEI